MYGLAWACSETILGECGPVVTRIFLVDDDALVSMNSAEDIPMDLGHTVLEASSAVHALLLLESDALFDVVITDYAMPGMTGLDLATKIKQLQPKMPVIIATGYADLPPQFTLNFPRLNKPYTQRQLADALETVSSATTETVRALRPRPAETTGVERIFRSDVANPSSLEIGWRRLCPLFCGCWVSSYRCDRLGAHTRHIDNLSDPLRRGFYFD